MALFLRDKSASKLLARFVFSHRQFCTTNPPLQQALAFEEVQSSTDKPYTSTALFIHGLLGSGRNWRSFARSLASNLSNSSACEWRMVLVDLRNHGRSAEVEGLDPPHDIVNAANDVAQLVKSQCWASPDVVVGHSLGGKVALQFVESCARGDYGSSIALPKQLWVLDSVAGEVKPEYSSGGEVEKVLQTLEDLPSSIPSRKWLVDHMITLGFSRSLSEWIGTNLKKSGEQLTWAFNLEGAVQMFDSYQKTSYWSLLEHPPKGIEIEIVRAEKSDRWDSETIERLESIGRMKGDRANGNVGVHLLPNSGHWVHVDNPKGLVEIMTPKIVSLNSER